MIWRNMIFLFLLLLLSAPAHALQSELQIPDTVDVNHKACQEILRLGKKYGVERIFPAEFEEGKISHARLDIAVALEMVTERMAEKAAREGAQAVCREDLEVLNQLREELRGEMILVQTQSFQQRRAEYGTRLHALTRNITMSGGLTGVVQGSANNSPRDHVDAVGRADLIFKFTVGESTIAVIDAEATGGDGLDSRIPSFSLLNGVAGSTGDTVRFREAWVEHSAFNDAILVTAGKIDLTNYFDANAVANDETTQFLMSAFVNNLALSIPNNAPGLVGYFDTKKGYSFGLGLQSNDNSGKAVTDRLYGIAEVDYYAPKFLFGLGGNYRLWGRYNGDTKSRAAGLSFDQQLTQRLTAFSRFGITGNTVPDEVEWAWSLGLGLRSPFSSRRYDHTGLAFSQLKMPNGKKENLAETYYSFFITDHMNISLNSQVIFDSVRGLDDPEDSDYLSTFGLRMQMDF